ncbi:unnamed protein product [marine sediment metagenome]|uniref:Damage-control phosphatase ARMT1-like metal-binding domain-containing protein n=1 Tax=marine sediment metagenome TaxID=412755 RepID=X1MRB9_9ZZZZ
MKTHLSCIPCFFKQALEAARLAGADEVTQKKVLDELARLLGDFSLSDCPPQMGKIIYGLVRKITGKDDPFKEIKDKSNRFALALYPEMKKKVEDSDDRLLTAVELAIAGNIIDYGVKNSLEVEKEIEEFLNQGFSVNSKNNKVRFDYQDFKWIIDPLDGTHNYIKGITVFGVSIALEFKNEVVLGVIYMPLAKSPFASISTLSPFSFRPLTITS